MATTDELYTALRNADAAGDVEGARKLTAYIKSVPAAKPAAPQSFAASPTEGNSFIGNAAAGVGSAMTDLALGAKQRLDEGASYLESKLGGQKINQALGLKNASDIQKETQAAVADKRQLDTPLLATGGGKTGQFVGKAAPAVAAAFVPGGQSLAGSMIAGGGLGFAEPTLKGNNTLSSLVTGENIRQDESPFLNALAGMFGGAAGYAGGKAIAAGANALKSRAVTNAGTNAARDAVAAGAKDAGYVIPPVQTNPTILNKTLEGFSGKLSTAQSASVKNQPVTNKLVSKALGLPEGEPITREALGKIRADAGQAYQAVENSGTIIPTQAYTDKLDAIVKPYLLAAKSFPNGKANPVIAEIEALKTPQFDAASAVAKIRALRADADAAYGSGNKDLGKALKSGAQALEDAIDTHLTSINAPADMLKNFREARQVIAKTYSVQNALNDSTGNVVAGKLAKQLSKGKPLSGELKDIAQFSSSFPKAAAEVNSSMPGISPLDFIGSSLLHQPLGTALSLASLGARPLARSAILSKPYQNALGAPSYGGSTTLNALASNPSRLALQAGGVMSPQFTKK